MKLDTSIIEKYNDPIFAGETNVPMLNCWKLFSWDEYLLFVNKEQTDRLNDIVNLRDTNPYEYYNNILERAYTNIE